MAIKWHMNAEVSVSANVWEERSDDSFGVADMHLVELLMGEGWFTDNLKPCSLHVWAFQSFFVSRAEWMLLATIFVASELPLQRLWGSYWPIGKPCSAAVTSMALEWSPNANYNAHPLGGY
jgi:hypothetical protein